MKDERITMLKCIVSWSWTGGLIWTLNAMIIYFLVCDKAKGLVVSGGILLSGLFYDGLTELQHKRLVGYRRKR